MTGVDRRRPGLRRRVLGRVPVFARSYAQVESYRLAWEAQADDAAEGPLWVVLGDSAAQGVGASAFDRGYVGQVRELLEARDGLRWRVLNLSVSGAKVADVVARQLPRLNGLAEEPALVSAVVGGNDALGTPLARWLPDLDALVAGLPRGALVGTVARGVRERKVATANAHLREAAAARGLLVADLWAHTGPPWRGLYADGFHPNDRGYRQWTSALAAALGLPTPPVPDP